MTATIRAIRAALLLAVLAACAPDPGTVAPDLVGTPLENCCTDAERVSPVLALLAEPFGPVVGQIVNSSRSRPGYLATPSAQAAILRQLRPLDLVAASNKGRKAGAIIPGLFGHVAVYLGTEAELRRLGAWDDPRLRPHHAAIRAGAVFIEADVQGVHLSAPGVTLDTDAVALLRPRLPSSRRAGVAAALAGEIGRCFDFHFDNRTRDKVFCTELVSRTMPETALPTRRLYGRPTTLPDDAVAQTVVGRSQLDLVAYFRGTPEGWARAGRADLIGDLLAWWQAPHPALVPPPPPASCTGTPAVCPID